MSTKLYIREIIEYEVEGETAYAAMRAFFDNPNLYLTGVTERDVRDEDDSDIDEEVQRAECDS